MVAFSLLPNWDPALPLNAKAYATVEALDQDPPYTRRAAHIRLLDHCVQTRE
jgi:hypothetical protein